MKLNTSFIFQTLFIVLLTATFTSCATIFSDMKADILVESEVDEPVTINSGAREYKDVTPPALLEVNHRQPNGQPANYKRHELNASLGFGPNQADHTTQHFIDGFTLPRHMEIEGECGDIFGKSYIVGKMEYHYRLNRKWDIGATMAWGRSSESYTNEDFHVVKQNNNSSIVTTGYETCRSFSFTPSARYTWFERRCCRLYSRVALGMMRNRLHFDLEEWKGVRPLESCQGNAHEEHFDNTKWCMAYQISPFGMSLGPAPVKFFFELGYGCLGVCNMGLSVSF